MHVCIPLNKSVRTDPEDERIGDSYDGMYKLAGYCKMCGGLYFEDNYGPGGFWERAIPMCDHEYIGIDDLRQAE